MKRDKNVPIDPLLLLIRKRIAINVPKKIEPLINLFLNLFKNIPKYEVNKKLNDINSKLANLKAPVVVVNSPTLLPPIITLGIKTNKDIKAAKHIVLNIFSLFLKSLNS